jgi:hypothetical protein
MEFVEKNPDERILSAEEMDVAKHFCLEALAFSVREKQLERDAAIDLLAEWFPDDRVAVASLYRRIASGSGQKA